jgi:hypothetical protein
VEKYDPVRIEDEKKALKSFKSKEGEDQKLVLPSLPVNKVRKNGENLETENVLTSKPVK